MAEESTKLRLRTLTMDDYPQLARLMNLVYPDIGGAWPKKTLAALTGKFPEGQLGIEDHDELVAVALTIKVSYDRFSNPHRYEDLITENQIHLHDADGDALYGLDVLVHPEYRGYRLGRRLYEARKDLCREENLRGILAGGRLPGYAGQADKMSVMEYIDQVERQKLHDPILSFQLSNGFDVKRLLTRYLPEDSKSRGYATLLEWDNILYEPPATSDYVSKSVARIGVVQRRMRAARSVEDLLSQVEFFVDALSDYRADFCVLPEFFSAPLMGLELDMSSLDAIRFLSGFTPEIATALSDMAVSYNINIIAGSMPLVDDGDVYNVAYLCRRDGTVEEQRKIHITPSERRDWGIEGGNNLQVFETDAGRIGILICYDVEFPELSRILAEEGMEILFVPFWTDTKNGYLRVRHCAQARAIENECYVAIAGSCGNLPRVDNVDIQYAQSAVFTPSDFYFPHDGIISEAVPNTEMLVFADVDLEKLKLLHKEGSVTNLKDRRKDLYTLSRKKP
ncbi:bifunctional GNAT family N-acetyltransferase/carbon-nitrogen hydrolase family protein [Alcanivorax sp. 1008]|uniref:bifunctional GNAT family N-acetyltransferase/carbon-nitrogen hydrolase family protein n=1 Tax=Alcanivorax sp. 1008 TaxID=2816853 RepID=UPI001E09716D|nr:bifunctional GNAT family N-acetyltransferase/carbon-nitrogen hydrolase family protein [Alcanivorax sp. 1008]MCC1497729.1 GNAT family N-acetyltransferase [Alcanivorax sp. 1008]